MIEQDILVIGSGVAGMSAAQYAARGGRSVTVIESIAPGGQTMYIDMIENYPGFNEPINGPDLGLRFHNQAEQFGAKLVYATVTGIEKVGDLFQVTTADDQIYQARAVIYATGAQHRHLGVPGEEEYNGRGVSYCAVCDGNFFRDKKILVIGGGDTALTDAIYLSKLSKEITLVHRRDRFRAQDNLIKQVERNKNIERVMSHTVEEILGDGERVTGVVLNDLEKGVQYEREFDAVFVFVGMIPQTELLDQTVLTADRYVKTNERMETITNGLYAAGDVRDTVFRQLVTAAADGAVAAYCANAYIDELEGRAYV